MRDARGFTLVETLVSLTLLALVATMLFGGLRFGARSWDAAATRTEAQAETAAVRAFLSARLSEVSQLEGAEAAVEGTAEGIAFSAPWIGGPTPPGIYRFSLAREGDQLMLAWRPQDAARADLAGRRALLGGVARAAFAYYGAAEGGSPGWRPAWPAARGAPRLVRLTIDFADPARAWAPLVIRRAL